MSLNVSSFFRGSALRFSVAGEGVSIDPATGEIGIAPEALGTGFMVTVTAQPAAGGAEQSLRLRIAAEPEAFAPVLLAAPVLTGGGRIGETLEIVAGSWAASRRRRSRCSGSRTARRSPARPKLAT